MRNNLPEFHSELKQAISVVCKSKNIENTAYFVQKVCQLYEMLEIRAGVMIVGDSFSGKTTIYRVLSAALNILESKDQENDCQPLCKIINPKSVKIGQLYGEFDVISNEWNDGILAINFRQINNINDNKRKWLIFDGPVDSIWMENINSLLDDNRKLCLMSGDIICLKNSINLLFETLDLTNASPSIVRIQQFHGLLCMLAL